MALRIHSHLFGLGGAISAFEGSSNHRLVFVVTPPLTGTPVLAPSCYGRMPTLALGSGAA